MARNPHCLAILSLQELHRLASLLLKKSELGQNTRFSRFFLNHAHGLDLRLLKNWSDVSPGSAKVRIFFEQ
jgi:hypothetical protein